jgi:exopolysaccharide biosynthesis polyprenyl glycosylphosphotransferase
MLLLVIPFGPILLEMQGFYNRILGKGMEVSLDQMLKAFLGLALLLAACVIFFKYPSPPRSIPILFLLFGGSLVLIREQISQAIYSRRVRELDLRERVILAGGEQDLQRLEESLESEILASINIVAKVDIEKESIDHLVKNLHQFSVSKVIFSANHSQMQRVEEAVAACEIEGVEVWLLANFIQTQITRPRFESLFGRPVIVFRSTPEVSWALLLKDVFDRVLALGLLIAAAIPMLIVAIIIKLTSNGPVIFRQERSGRYGKPFTMLKFRSMYVGAEARRHELAGQNKMSGPVFKLENDPRITPIGRVIRKTSIDELPQLFNILRGEMSLVGPRPLPVYEVRRFDQNAQRRRLSVKPGLTCLWQISGRNEVTDFNEWVRLDLEYIDNWSIWLDLKILFKTIPVVMFGLGAK